MIDDLAVPLPVTIIAEMLGVDAGRRADFKRWSNALVSVMSGAASRGSVDAGPLQDVAELFLFLRETVRERRRHPGDDLVSVLVDPARDGVLDELDMVQFVVLLLVAGNETTTNLIGNAAARAARASATPSNAWPASPSACPRSWKRRCASTRRSRWSSARSAEDTELAGTRIPRGAIVAALLGSANRDERAFAEPDRFDVERDTRGHLAFGFGPHFCLGAALARLEARVALEALVPELVHCKRVGERNARIDSFLVRGRAHLDIVAESDV